MSLISHLMAPQILIVTHCRSPDPQTSDFELQIALFQIKMWFSLYQNYITYRGKS